jgi:hypothetical protein
MSYADPQFMCHQKKLKSDYIAFLNVPKIDMHKIGIKHYGFVKIFPSVNNPNTADLLLQRTSKVSARNPIGYVSINRDGLTILNKEYSLFVTDSEVVKIKIETISEVNVGKSVQLILGMSADEDITLQFTSNGQSLLDVGIQKNEISQLKLNVNLGDLIQITQNQYNSKTKSKLYISSPHLSDCI